MGAGNRAATIGVLNRLSPIDHGDPEAVPTPDEYLQDF